MIVRWKLHLTHSAMLWLFSEDVSQFQSSSNSEMNVYERFLVIAASLQWFLKFIVSLFLFSIIISFFIWWIILIIILVWSALACLISVFILILSRIFRFINVICSLLTVLKRLIVILLQWSIQSITTAEQLIQRVLRITRTVHVWEIYVVLILLKLSVFLSNL